MSQDIAMSKSAFQKAFSFRENSQSIYQRRASNFVALDGIRALSILLVLVYHTFLVYDLSNPHKTVASMLAKLGWDWTWAWNGDKGVDVFFAMSGFLISGILLRQYSWSMGQVLLYGFVVSSVLNFSIATLMYLFIEKPVMNLRC